MRKVISKMIFLLKQLLPLKYCSKYKDAKGDLHITIWRQWFGKVLNSTTFKVCNRSCDN